MTTLKKITQKQLFLPLFSMVLVMLINIVYDVAHANPFYNFFTIDVQINNFVVVYFIY